MFVLTGRLSKLLCQEIFSRKETKDFVVVYVPPLWEDCSPLTSATTLHDRLHVVSALLVGVAANVAHDEQIEDFWVEHRGFSGLACSL